MILNKNDMAYVVIVGIDDERGVHIARTMKRHGIPFIGIAIEHKSPGTYAKGYEEILYSNIYDDEFIGVLEKLGPKFDRKAVLIPCYDIAVLLISRNRHRIKDWYHILLPDSETVELIRDKVRFYTYAQDRGFPLPKTYILCSRKDADETSENLTFPCVLKPPDSKSASWRKKTYIKVFKVMNKEEYLSLFDRYHDTGDVLIAQEYIPGGDENLYSCYLYFDASSKPLVAFTSRKLRQWPPETGVGCFAEEVEEKIVEDEAIKMMQSLNFYGICGFEMKKSSETGEFFIIEANIGRPAGRFAHVEGSGVEFLYTLYCDAVGISLPKERVQIFNGVKFIHFRRDLSSFLMYWKRGELTFWNWLKSLRGKKVFALFSWSEPMPFFVDLFHTFRKFLKSTERSKRNL